LLMRKYYPPAPRVPACNACGHKLTADDEQARKCSSCGTRVEPLLLRRPLPCFRCGYDLRQSPVECPECGLSVRETAHEINREALRQVEARRRKGWVFFGVGMVLVGIMMLTTNLITSLTPIELHTLEQGGNLRPERMSVYYTEIVAGCFFTIFGLGCMGYYVAALEADRRPREAK
jgi:hypothetical protein